MSEQAKAEIIRLKRAVVIQRRRLQEHNAKPCPYAGGRGPCPWAGREQRKLIKLWRRLRDLGFDDPEMIGT